MSLWNRRKTANSSTRSRRLTPGVDPLEGRKVLSIYGTHHTASLEFVNNLSVEVTNVKVVHNYGLSSHTYNVGTVAQGGGTNWPGTIDYYTGSGSPDDYWTVSGKYTNPDGTKHAFVDLFYEFDLHSQDSGSTLKVSLNNDNSPDWWDPYNLDLDYSAKSHESYHDITVF